MRNLFFIATLFLGVLSVQAQEKVMKVLKKDGTCAKTRVADLKEISFLMVDGTGQSLQVKTLGGETADVLFEANPVVTVSDGKLIVKPRKADAVEFEISNIAEILFGQTTGVKIAGEEKGFSCLLQEGGALLRGIPKGVRPRIYTLDGRSVTTPPVHGGELRLNRITLGTGVFIVKVGTFSTKIKI